MLAADIQEYRKQYFQDVEKYLDRRPNIRLVDKFPLNIVHIPLIVRLFPDSQFILALCHPCDVVLSNFMQMYKINDAMAHFHTIGGAAQFFHQVMSPW